MNVLTKGQQESNSKTPTGSTESFFNELLLLERKQIVERGRKIEEMLLKQGVITKRYILLRGTN